MKEDNFMKICQIIDAIILSYTIDTTIFFFSLFSHLILSDLSVKRDRIIQKRKNDMFEQCEMRVNDKMLDHMILKRDK